MISQRRSYIILMLLPVIMIIFSIYYLDMNFLTNLSNILFSKSTLITDYLEIGGISATFINASIVALFNIALVYFFRLEINGLLISSIFITLAFSFIGKNFLNIIPFYFGAYLYTLVMNKNFKSIMTVTMMSTTLAPVVSDIPIYGIFIAIFIGFVMPSISSQTLHFHNGYSLYNTGFAGGLLGIIIYSTLLANNINFKLSNNYYKEYNMYIFAMFFIYYTILILIALKNTKYIFSKLRKLHKHTGRLVTDFVQKDGFYITLFNMGILGYFCLFVIHIFNILNGPTICAMLSVVAFGGFGKHLKNILPIIAGVVIAKYILKVDVDDTIFIMTMFFSTTLAPISGKFGVVYGIVAGFLHFVVTIQIGSVHGGLNLYNNGLAAGIVASVLVPIIETLNGGIENVRRKKENIKND